MQPRWKLPPRRSAVAAAAAGEMLPGLTALLLRRCCCFVNVMIRLFCWRSPRDKRRRRRGEDPRQREGEFRKEITGDPGGGDGGAGGVVVVVVAGVGGGVDGGYNWRTGGDEARWDWVTTRAGDAEDTGADGEERAGESRDEVGEDCHRRFRRLRFHRRRRFPYQKRFGDGDVGGKFRVV